MKFKANERLIMEIDIANNRYRWWDKGVCEHWYSCNLTKMISYAMNWGYIRIDSFKSYNKSL